MPQSTLTTAVGSHFIWQPPSRDIAILLNLDLVERLHQLMERSGPEEIGGVLLGRCEYVHSTSDRRIVTVEDFEAVESEHVRGPAYALSPHDKKGLDRVLMRIRRKDEIAPVGFFRSHLRKGIYLDEADFSLFRTHFSGPCDVFLVARPQPGGSPVAGFFFWEDDTLERRTTYSQFPLDRGKLELSAPVVETVPETPVTPAPTPVVALRPAEAQVPAQAPAAIHRPAAVHRPAAAPVRLTARVTSARPRGRVVITHPRFAKRVVYATLGVLMILTALAWATVMRSASSVKTAGPSTMSLNVERDGPQLLLHWDPRASLVEHATAGVLWISDGGHQQRVDLSRDSLDNGTFAYAPLSNDVRFRMDLTGAATARSESVRFVADQHAPLTSPAMIPASTTGHEAVAAPVPKPPSTPRDEQADRAAPAVEASAPQRTPALTASAEPPSEPVAEPPPMERSETVARPLPQPGPPARVTEQRTRPNVHLEPLVSITTEPIPPSKSRSWFRKMPLIRVLDRERSEQFVPARLVRQVTPRVPPRLARELPAESRVDLKMSINAEGFVDRIEVLSGSSDERLAEIATDAASQFRFDPARADAKPVKSQMLVSVRVRNPESGAVAQQR